MPKVSCVDAITTEKLTKSFNGFTAVDSISITVREGELFGLLGPNGAGKTTLINMLSTMTRPTSGSARVHGFDVVRDASSVRASIGVVFQSTTLDDRLTGRENLELHGRLYGMPKKLRRERMEEVLELVELTDKADILVKTYSGGMMRRLEIARGLMHHPRVLFLDEPTLGLDPQTRLHIWDYIQRLNRVEGVTMVLTTHYMEEADNLCDRIAIIDHGKIVALDTSENLKSALGGDIITLNLNSPEDAEKLSMLYNASNSTASITSISCVNSTLQLRVNKSEEAIPRLLSTAFHSGVSIQSLSLRTPTLDDVFLHHTGRGIRDELVDDVGRVTYKMQTRKR